jgi:hypothetical protein
MARLELAIQPYTHCVLRDVFEPAALKSVRDEIINNIQATYKETDLFKVCRFSSIEGTTSPAMYPWHQVVPSLPPPLSRCSRLVIWGTSPG